MKVKEAWVIIELANSLKSRIDSKFGNYCRNTSCYDCKYFHQVGDCRENWNKYNGDLELD